MAKTQPGFYRLAFGDFEVTALSDGVIAYETQRLVPGLTPQEIKNRLSAAGLTDPIGLSYNAYLINTGDRLILIDTGTGGKLDDSPYLHGAGRVMANLRAAGYQPEQVDEVYITHVGPDHIGGLTTGTERTFPNATLRASKAEIDFYLESKEGRRDPFWFQFRKSQFEPYVKAGKFLSIDGDITLVPGIRALDTRGHTPGHTSYVVESKGQLLVILGDLVLESAMQIPDPSVLGGADADPNAAAAQRRRVLEMAAEHDYLLAGSHISFPGIGRVRLQNGRYSWLPANYAIPQ